MLFLSPLLSYFSCTIAFFTEISWHLSAQTCGGVPGSQSISAFKSNSPSRTILLQSYKKDIYIFFPDKHILYAFLFLSRMCDITTVFVLLPPLSIPASPVVDMRRMGDVSLLFRNNIYGIIKNLTKIYLI